MIEKREIALFLCCGYREELPDPPEGMDSPLMYGDGIWGHDYLYLGPCPNFGNKCDEGQPNVDVYFQLAVVKD